MGEQQVYLAYTTICTVIKCYHIMPQLYIVACNIKPTRQVGFMFFMYNVFVPQFSV